MDREHFMKYDDFKQVGEELKNCIDEDFTKESFEHYLKINKLAKIQKEKLENLAKHYFDFDDIESGLDERFAYYQIIEDCLKIIKENDKTLSDKVCLESEVN